MSLRRSRKRRHEEAFEQDSNYEESHVNVNKEVDMNGGEQEQDDDALMKKEQDTWDAFREENFEAIEQLPLSLHRQYALMHELDEQAEGYAKELLPAIQNYIKLRRSLASCYESEKQTGDVEMDFPTPEVEVTAKSEPPATPTGNLLDPRPSDKNSPNSSPGPISPPAPSPKNQALAPSLAVQTSTPLVETMLLCAARTTTPFSKPQDQLKQPQNTREMLVHIARLSEEIQRASDEKFNLAQAAYDSVDRHIRLLDQAIKEQEASISLGIRPGTNLAPILLPEVIVPGSRPVKVLHERDEDSGMTLGMMGGDDGVDDVQPQRRSKNNKKIGRRSLKKGVTETVPRGRSVGASRILTLKGPVAEMISEYADEPRYCYCNQVSFGEMVACDNEDCEREWFHLGCVGLEKPPADDASWYCRECQQLVKNSRKAKLRRKRR